MLVVADIGSDWIDICVVKWWCVIPLFRPTRGWSEVKVRLGCPLLNIYLFLYYKFLPVQLSYITLDCCMPN